MKRWRWPRMLALLALLAQGCVAMTEPRNYRPAALDRDQVYYDCYRDAQQPQAAASRVYAAAGYQLNHDMLEHCMNAKGFHLRRPTVGETVFGLVTAPVWFPVGLITGIKPFKIGGGEGGE